VSESRDSAQGLLARAGKNHGESVRKATASPPTETQDTTICWHPTVQHGLKRSEGMYENPKLPPGQPALWHQPRGLSSPAAGIWINQSCRSIESSVVLCSPREARCTRMGSMTRVIRARVSMGNRLFCKNGLPACTCLGERKSVINLNKTVISSC
jgi:hypothetical protein